MILSSTRKNITKRTGIGCLSVGLLLILTALGVLVVSLVFGFSQQIAIALGGLLLAFGLIALAAGIVGIYRGRQVDRLLAGEDLLARWDYLVDEKGRRKPGYVYIGTRGFYKDGFYVAWSDKCILRQVSYREGTPATLVFQYVRKNYNRNAGGWSSLQNNFPVPVPPEHSEQALRVVAHYQRELKKAAKKNADPNGKTK